MEKLLERNIERNFLDKPHSEKDIDFISKELELLSGEISFKIEKFFGVNKETENALCCDVACFYFVVYEILTNSYDGIIAKAGNDGYINVRLYHKNSKFILFIHDNGVGIMKKEKESELLFGGLGIGETLIRDYSTSYNRRYSENGSHAKVELDLNIEK